MENPGEISLTEEISKGISNNEDHDNKCNDKNHKISNLKVKELKNIDCEKLLDEKNTSIKDKAEINAVKLDQGKENNKMENLAVETRTTRVKSILKKPAAPVSLHSNNSNLNLTVQLPKSAENTLTDSKLKVELIFWGYGENNNYMDNMPATCWYKLLSVLCYWRVRLHQI